MQKVMVLHTVDRLSRLVQAVAVTAENLREHMITEIWRLRFQNFCRKEDKVEENNRI